MSFLKKLPIRYTGELHDVRLINFSIDPQEIAGQLPEPLKLRLFDGRALISMVDVQLKKMHPAFTPDFCRFHYRHIAFRLLVDDSAYSRDLKGIYFLRSFTASPLLAAAGSMFTIYRLQSAQIHTEGQTVQLEADGKVLEYTLSDTHVIEKEPWLKECIGHIDRAYAVEGDDVYTVQIQREKWPIEWVKCEHFSTSFFQTARLEGAFRVKEMIPYTWLPPRKLGNAAARKASQSQPRSVSINS